MPTSLNEKQRLEIGALEQFSKALGDRRFVFHELRDPPEPDSWCSMDGQALHVEVGHFYGTTADARQILGREGKSATTSIEQLNSALVPIRVKLLSELNKLLIAKATKSYQTQRALLLIRSASPSWDIDDFKKHQASIDIPSKHPFDQIWLLGGPRSHFGVMRLA